MMKRLSAVALAGLVALSSGACKNFLDVNTNPNAPQTVTANLYMPPMLHWMITSPLYDGRYLGRYVQMWTYPYSGTTPSIWDEMGYAANSDAAAEQWRDVYWTLGSNLIAMMDKSAAEERWDMLGVGYVMKAWGWQALTDLHGPIIIKEAFDPTRFSFDYDSQEFAYQEVSRLLDSAIVNLQRTDGAVDPTYLAVGDHMYNGDRTKWLKLAYALKAMNLNHYSNKSTYDPQAVIDAVDHSFESNADDALFPFPAQQANDDRNFFGPTRGNLPWYRQTEFIVGLMDGTQFAGAVDPRMSRMLSASPDGSFRGLDPNIGNAYYLLPDSLKPNNVFGYPGSQGSGLPSKYIFSDKSHFPFVTYAELQFIKAEAAYRMGDMATAKQAYINGISSHIDFVNARNTDDGQWPTQISAEEKAAFLADTSIVPTGDITLSAIMSQKYIALWGWGFDEIWLDMRRYHYTDEDPVVSGTEVFRGFKLPTTYMGDNGGKPVQRVRPRYNSEYVWNMPALEAIGGDKPDYHTKPLWITQP